MVVIGLVYLKFCVDGQKNPRFVTQHDADNEDTY
jgi:hypothetical protein